jgi:DNA-binding beta-propeller fold protein YncE
MSRVALQPGLALLFFIAINEFTLGQQPQTSWITEKVFSVPESVCHDPVRNLLYVSNINGKPAEKDGNGFISIISPEGIIIDQNWASGLNAPKGMGVTGDILYVTDIDRVAEIDTRTGAVLRFHSVEGSQFLNDIAVDGFGNVYISDMMDQKIYRITDGKLEAWIDDPVIKQPNGLDIVGTELFIGCGKIVKADLKTGRLTVWLEGTGSIDGLESTGADTFVYSDWQGKLFRADHKHGAKEFMDLSSQKMNAADIEYVPEQKLLLVPTFFDNRVVAFKLE